MGRFIQPITIQNSQFRVIFEFSFFEFLLRIQHVMMEWSYWERNVGSARMCHF